MKFLILLALVAAAYGAPQYLVSDGATVIQGAKSTSSGPSGSITHDSGSITKSDLRWIDGVEVKPVVNTRITTLDRLVKPLVDPIPVTRITTLEPLVKPLVDPIPVTRITTLEPLVKPLVDPIPVSTRITTLDPLVKPLVDPIPLLSTRYITLSDFDATMMAELAGYNMPIYSNLRAFWK